MKHFEDGSWTLPVESLVIVDDADHLHPDLLRSLVEQAAVRTNTKLLLITHPGTDRGHDRGVGRTNGEIAVLRESLPWPNTSERQPETLSATTSSTAPAAT